MNAWTNGPGRTQSSCELRTLLSVALALSISVTLLSSSGCEISVDSSASSSAGSNDVAQGGSGTAGHESTTDPTAANDAPADPTPSDPLNPNLRKDASPTPDSPKTNPATPDPTTPDAPTPDATTANSPNSDSPNSGTAKNDTLKSGSPPNDVSKSDAAKPDARNTDSPKPDAPKPGATRPDNPRPDTVNTAGRSSAGPKKELLPIESTARNALAREPGIEVITFDDLNLGMQADMVFRDFLLNDRVRELEGQKVRLIGYMHGGVSQLKDLREFVLLRNTECKFGPGGLADHLVRVFMKSQPGAEYTTSAIQIDGLLKVNPFQGPDGNTWSVYDIEAQSIKIIKK